MIIPTIIAAVNNKMGLGINNTIPWHSKEDFQHFKKTTLNSTVIFGRKTYESLPKKPLPQRRNVVLSRNLNLGFPNCVWCDSLSMAIDLAIENGDSPFVCGGAEIYKQALEISKIRRMIITRIDDDSECDTFFPAFSTDDWKIIHKQPIADGVIEYYGRITRNENE